MIPLKTKISKIKVNENYNVHCHGNSCAYGLPTSSKLGYIISNAYVKMGCAYVSYLSSQCHCIRIKFTETWIILEMLLLSVLVVTLYVNIKMLISECHLQRK